MPNVCSLILKGTDIEPLSRISTQGFPGNEQQPLALSGAQNPAMSKTSFDLLLKFIYRHSDFLHDRKPIYCFDLYLGST